MLKAGTPWTTVFLAINRTILKVPLWISSNLSMITDNPLILLFFLVSFIGLAVGLIQRIKNL